MKKILFLLTAVFTLLITLTNLQAGTQPSTNINTWLEKLEITINNYNNRDKTHIRSKLIGYYKYYGDIADSIIKTEEKNNQIIDYIPFCKTPSMINEPESYLKSLNIEPNRPIPILRPNILSITNENSQNIFTKRKPEHYYSKTNSTNPSFNAAGYDYIYLQNNNKMHFPTSQITGVDEVSIKLKSQNPVVPLGTGHSLIQLWWTAPYPGTPFITCTFETGIIKSDMFTPGNETNTIFIFSTNNGYSKGSNYYNLSGGTNCPFVQTNSNFTFGTPVSENSIYILKYKHDKTTGRVYYYVQNMTTDKTPQCIGFYKASWANKFFNEFKTSSFSCGVEIDLGTSGIYTYSGTIYNCATNLVSYIPDSFLKQNNYPGGQGLNAEIVDGHLEVFGTELYNKLSKFCNIKLVNNTSFPINLEYTDYNQAYIGNSVGTLDKSTISNSDLNVTLYTGEYLGKDNEKSLSIAGTSTDGLYKLYGGINVGADNNISANITGEGINATANYNQTGKQLTITLNNSAKIPSVFKSSKVTFENNTNFNINLNLNQNKVFFSNTTFNSPLQSIILSANSKQTYRLCSFKDSLNTPIEMNGTFGEFQLSCNLQFASNSDTELLLKEIKAYGLLFNVCLNENDINITIDEENNKFIKKVYCSLIFKNNTDNELSVAFTPNGTFLSPIPFFLNLIQVDKQSNSMTYSLVSYNQSPLPFTKVLNNCLSGKMHFSKTTTGETQLHCSLSGNNAAAEFNEIIEPNKTYVIEINEN